MATESNMQILFHELKNIFPEIPQEIIQANIMKFASNRDACLKQLNKESERFKCNSFSSSTTESPVKDQFSPLMSSSNNVYGIGRELQQNHHVFSRQNCGISNMENFHSNFNFPNNTRIQESNLTPGLRHSHSSQEVPDVIRQNKNLESRSPSLNLIKPEQPDVPFGSENCMKPTGSTPRHVTRMEINPQPYYAPNGQYFDLFRSGSGRHSTAVNIQLRQPSLEVQPPLEIISTPLCPIPSRDFNSQLQISITSSGAAVTALRKQRQSQSPNSLQPPAGYLSPTHMLSSNSLVSPQNLASHTKAKASTNLAFGNPRQSPERPISWPSTQTDPHRNIIDQSDPWPSKLFQQPMQCITNPIQQGPTTAGSGFRKDDDKAYTQALLLHQRARLDILKRELENVKKLKEQLCSEVLTMEEELCRRNTNNSPFVNVENLQKYQEEKRRLQVACHCLSREVDLYNEGQDKLYSLWAHGLKVPLGVTDENFYKNIFTGPSGPIPPAVPKQDRESPQLSPGTLTPGNTSGMSEAEENDEGNMWKCSECTFHNHPALDKCEVCEMPRVIIGQPLYYSHCDMGGGPGPRQGVGHVQIHIRQNPFPNQNSVGKSLELRFTHRLGVIRR
ncbi:TAK1-associated binding protein 2 isoform X2 [Tachypleus tridentatus]|uniref:TAK1-associated binding protein 2 isoform X2 n=1 Tax=Tachypleus tridentatus TaxID=6853 RepID=UPI003FD0CC1F